MYTFYNITVDRNARLAMAPQPVFHCNQLIWHPLPSVHPELTLQVLPWLYSLGPDSVENTALTLLSGLAVT
jgi:hypothetical protein